MMLLYRVMAVEETEKNLEVHLNFTEDYLDSQLPQTNR